MVGSRVSNGSRLAWLRAGRASQTHLCIGTATRRAKRCEELEPFLCIESRRARKGLPGSLSDRSAQPRKLERLGLRRARSTCIRPTVRYKVPIAQYEYGGHACTVQYGIYGYLHAGTVHYKACVRTSIRACGRYVRVGGRKGLGESLGERSTQARVPRKRKTDEAIN